MRFASFLVFIISLTLKHSHSIPSGSITRSINAEDEPADARVGQVGSLSVLSIAGDNIASHRLFPRARAMLNPDPSVGFIDEREWFGILTWIQPVREAMEPRERTVCYVCCARFLADVVY